MKEFIKWLGVNEKIAKLVVWIFIIMVFLVLTNIMLDSIGFPHYQITYDNLKQIEANKLLQWLANWLMILSNFYAIELLIFNVKDYKKLLKYSLAFLVLNVIISQIFNYAIVQIFIILFILILNYYLSNKNKKYLLYSLMSIALNIIVQSVTYFYKAKLINYSSISYITRDLLFIDYIIIMGIIILVKEIYLKKRSERK